MTETMEIVIKHECQGCGLKVFTQGKDRLIGHVKKRYPEGWEEIRGMNICSGCVQGWNTLVDAAWVEYQETMKKKGTSREENKK